MKKRLFLINIFIILALSLTACNLPAVETEPAVGIETAVAQTVAAIGEKTDVPVVLPTLFSTSTPIVPTNTPLPTETPLPTATTPPTATMIPSVTVVPSATAVPIPCNRAGFVSDITVPDNTTFAPNTAFVKTWRLQNTGSCTWGTGYTLAFHSGNSMNGPASVNLPATIAPGQTVDVSVSLKSPGTAGSYIGNWMLKTPSGAYFGIGTNAEKVFWVKIVVGDSTTATEIAIKTQTSGSCVLVSSSPVSGKEFTPNADFDTRWKVKNISGSTWRSDSVDIRYKSGTKWFENGIEAYDLPADVANNAEYELILDSIAPSSVGTYSMTWVIAAGSNVLCTMTASIKVK